MIKSIHAIGKKGEYLIEDTRQAIALCLQGLAIAVSDPAYSFLIYNASVVYHRITRHLFVKGYRHLLAESMQQIVSALETLSEAETDMDWLINFFVNLSICYDEGDSFDAASKTIARAAQLVDSWKAASESLKDKVLRSQVHIFREKGVDFIMNEMDKSSHYSDASRLASAKGTLLLQKIKSGIISDAEVVEDTLHWVLELVGYPAASREGEEQIQGRASRRYAVLSATAIRQCPFSSCLLCLIYSERIAGLVCGI